ncbi:MAG: hypothetical protein ACJ70W_01625, partial [Nitrososphaera sp.]
FSKIYFTVIRIIKSLASCILEQVRYYAYDQLLDQKENYHSNVERNDNTLLMYVSELSFNFQSFKTKT